MKTPLELFALAVAAFFLGILAHIGASDWQAKDCAEQRTTK